MSTFTDLAVDIADKIIFTGSIQVGPGILRNIVVAVIAELEQRWQLTDEHIVEIDRYGSWAVQHPITERPNLLACPTGAAVGSWAEERTDSDPLQPGLTYARQKDAGRYLVEIRLTESVWRLFMAPYGDEDVELEEVF